ncbi:hypothetical protein MASR1M31_19470 [Porphyromonadaceae bacterium]
MDSFRIDVKESLKPSTSRKIYRVQVGAFNEKAHADNLLGKLKAEGYVEAFIKSE